MARKPPPATAADDLLLRELRDFLAAPKTLAIPIEWKPDAQHLTFTVPLDIEGVTQQGYLLRGRTIRALPDHDVSLQLTRAPPPRRNNFARLDWRPTQSHTNPRLPDSALGLLHIQGSHHHMLDANAARPGGLLAAMEANLPVALPLPAEPADWPALAALAGRLWNIADLRDAEAPPWQRSLAAPKGRTA